MMREQIIHIKAAAVFAIGGVIGYFEPINKFLVIMVLLVIADIFSGVRAAKVRKEDITSKRLKRKVQDIVWYALAIILAFHFENVFFRDNILQPIPLTFSVAFYIAVVEFKSNLENISVITGNDIAKRISTLLDGIVNPFRKDKDDTEG